MSLLMFTNTETGNLEPIQHKDCIYVVDDSETAQNTWTNQILAMNDSNQLFNSENKSSSTHNNDTSTSTEHTACVASLLQTNTVKHELFDNINKRSINFEESNILHSAARGNWGARLNHHNVE